jgi:hypothetical protein
MSSNKRPQGMEEEEEEGNVPCIVWETRFPVKTPQETRLAVRDHVVNKMLHTDIESFLAPTNVLAYKLDSTNFVLGWKQIVKALIVTYDTRLFRGSLGEYLSTRHTRIQVVLVRSVDDDAEEGVDTIEEDEEEAPREHGSKFTRFMIQIHHAALSEATRAFRAEPSRKLLVCGVECSNWFEVFQVNIELQLALLLTYTICSNPDEDSQRVRETRQFASKMFELSEDRGVYGAVIRLVEIVPRISNALAHATTFESCVRALAAMATYNQVSHKVSDESLSVIRKFMQQWDITPHQIRNRVWPARMWNIVEACMDLQPIHSSHPFTLLKVLLEAGVRYIMPFGSSDTQRRAERLRADPSVCLPPALDSNFAVATEERHGDKLIYSKESQSDFHLLDVPYAIAQLLIVTHPLRVKTLYQWLDIKAMRIDMGGYAERVFDSGNGWWCILTMILQTLRQPNIDPVHAVANVTTVMSDHDKLSSTKRAGYHSQGYAFGTNINSTNMWRAFANFAEQENYAHSGSSFVSFVNHLSQCTVSGIVSTSLNYIRTVGVEIDIRRSSMAKRCPMLTDLFSNLQYRREMDAALFCHLVRSILVMPVVGGAPTTRVIAYVHDVIDKFMFDISGGNERIRMFYLPLEDWATVCQCIAEVASTIQTWVRTWNSDHYSAWWQSDCLSLRKFAQICRARAEWVQALKDGTALPTPDMVEILQQLTRDGMPKVLQTIVLSDYLDYAAESDEEAMSEGSASASSLEASFPFRAYIARLVDRWHASPASQALTK